MSNDYFVSNGQPADASKGIAKRTRGRFDSVEDGFDKLPAEAAMLVGFTYTATAGGTANAITASISSKITSYLDGLRVSLLISSTNSGAMTVNLNGIGVASVKSPSGDELSSADCVAGTRCLFEYNSGLGYFVYFGPLFTTASASAIAGAVSNAITPLNLSRATVASHATTADIWSALGNQINWTGTATTTIFPNAPQAGAERTLICASTPSFIAGGNMLIEGVSSGQTMLCAANDEIIVQAISTTQFRIKRSRYDGKSQVTPNPSFVATGSITAGNTVALLTDGTVEVVAETVTAGVKSAEVEFEAGATTLIKGCHDAANNAVVLMYIDQDNSSYFTVVVGTVSGSVITFGTPVVAGSYAANFNNGYGCVPDPVSGKVIFFFCDASSYASYIVGTYAAGPSMTFGTKATINGNTSTNYLTGAIDPVDGIVMFTFIQSSTGYYQAGVVSGTALSLASATATATGYQPYFGNLLWNPVADTACLFYQKGGSSEILITQFSVNKSTRVPVLFDYDIEAVVYDYSTAIRSVAIDPNTGVMLLCYAQTTETTTYLMAVMPNNSGYLFSDPVEISTVDSSYASMAWDEAIQQFVISFVDASDSSYLKQISASVVVGDNKLFVYPGDLYSIATGGTCSYNAVVVDPDTEQVIIAYRDDGGTAGKAVVVTPQHTATNAADYVGPAVSTVSDSEVETITLPGEVNTSQTGLTARTDYWLNPDGTLSTTKTGFAKVGKAVSATAILRS